VTAPVPPPPNDLRPWNARMLDATLFSRVGRGQRQGYDIGEVDAFKARVVARVAELEADNTRLQIADRKKAELIATLQDDKAQDRHPWNGASQTAAVEALVRGQGQAERDGHHANLEAARIIDNARRMERDAEALLAKAKETAAAGPPELVLPPEPRPNKDPIADAAAQAAHIRACKAAIAEHRDALAEFKGAVERSLSDVDDLQGHLDEAEVALGERRDGVLATLDEVERHRAEVRADVEAIDLTGGSADEATQVHETTQVHEQVAS
jgi:hypothetical protein